MAASTTITFPYTHSHNHKVKNYDITSLNGTGVSVLGPAKLITIPDLMLYYIEASIMVPANISDYFINLPVYPKERNNGVLIGFNSSGSFLRIGIDYGKSNAAKISSPSKTEVAASFEIRFLDSYTKENTSSPVYVS